MLRSFVDLRLLRYSRPKSTIEERNAAYALDRIFSVSYGRDDVTMRIKGCYPRRFPSATAVRGGKGARKI
jgi:hypothetical protein